MGRVTKFMEKTNMKSVFCAGAGIQNILSEWRQPASRSSLCVGSFLCGRESGHSIARPIACGNRVPPQRTVLGETPDPQARVADR